LSLARVVHHAARITTARPLYPFLGRIMRAIARTAAAQTTERPPRLALAAGNSGGMCAAQRADFEAACDGKITWRQYFATWGRGPSL
jgi:hypothetical protein